MRPAALLLAVGLATVARAETPSPRDGSPAAPADSARTDPRTLRVEVGADGEVAVFRGDDPRAIRGAEVYRAVLRPDLLRSYERKRDARTFLFLAAGAAAVGGPALGYVFGRARGRAYHLCQNLLPEAQPSCRVANEVLSRSNARRRRDGLAVGAAVGVPLGLGLAWAGFSVRPRLPSGDEARSLVEGYNSRLTPTGLAEPRGLLLLEPTGDGARLVLRVGR